MSFEKQTKITKKKERKIAHHNHNKSALTNDVCSSCKYNILF